MFGSCDVGAVQTFLVCHRLLFWSSICLFCWAWRQEARAQGACFMHVYPHWEKEGEQTLPSFSVSLAHTHTGRSPASCIHPQTRTHTNTQTHTHIHTQTYVHTHSHTQVSCEKLDVFCIHFVSTHVEVCGYKCVHGDECEGNACLNMRLCKCARTDQPTVLQRSGLSGACVCFCVSYSGSGMHDVLPKNIHSAHRFDYGNS